MLVERETFESALRSGRRHSSDRRGPVRGARNCQQFRRANLATLQAMLPHFGDEAKTVAIAKSGREELEENLRRDREARSEPAKRGGWQ